MSKIGLLIQGKKIYPYIGNKYMKLLTKFDIKKYYNNIKSELSKKINENNELIPNTYDEFINKIKNDSNFKNKIKEYYENNNQKLITDSTYESFYIVELNNELPKDNYILDYVTKISDLNIYDMLANYKDLFDNEIVFR